MNSATGYVHPKELVISKEQFSDHLAAFLRASGFIHHDEDVSISFDTKELKSNGDTLALAINTKKNKEERLVVIEHK